jgi:hypothetical protein
MPDSLPPPVAPVAPVTPLELDPLLLLNIYVLIGGETMKLERGANFRGCRGGG